MIATRPPQDAATPPHEQDPGPTFAEILVVWEHLAPDAAPGIACRVLQTFPCGAPSCPATWWIWHDDLKEQHYFQHRASDRRRPDLGRALDDWQLGRDFAGDPLIALTKIFGPRVHPAMATGRLGGRDW